MSKGASKTVLITGTSKGGIGSGLAFEFQKRGYTVFATARNTSRIDPELTKLARVHVLLLDVTSHESIRFAVKSVESSTGGTLDILVNNSGRGYTEPITDLNMNTARALFDVNVWGLLETTKEFAPLLVKSRGTIVNISSVAGELRMPLQGKQSFSVSIHQLTSEGVYNASKSAVTMFSEVLRLEMKPLGVKVITSIAGAVESAFFDNVETEDLPESSLYLPIEKHYRAFSSGSSIPKFQAMDKFVKNFVNDVEGGASGKVWRGANSSATKYLLALLPRFMVDMIVERITGLNRF